MKPHDEVVAWLELYATASGREFQDQRKHHYTDHPSVQGPWNPFTNVDPDVVSATFPNAELSAPVNRHISATQQAEKHVIIR